MIDRRLLVSIAPWLVGIVALIGLWAWVQAMPVQVRWNGALPPPQAGGPAPEPAPARRVVDLQTYSAVWEVPLFSPGRRPDASQVRELDMPAPDLGGLVLSGVVIAPPLRLALLKQYDGQSLSVREGDSLPSGWLLEQVEEQRIQLTHGTHRQTLEISSPRLPMPVQ